MASTTRRSGSPRWAASHSVLTSGSWPNGVIGSRPDRRDAGAGARAGSRRAGRALPPSGDRPPSRRARARRASARRRPSSPSIVPGPRLHREPGRLPGREPAVQHAGGGIAHAPERRRGQRGLHAVGAGDEHGGARVWRGAADEELEPAAPDPPRAGHVPALVDVARVHAHHHRVADGPGRHVLDHAAGRLEAERGDDRLAGLERAARAHATPARRPPAPPRAGSPCA